MFTPARIATDVSPARFAVMNPCSKVCVGCKCTTWRGVHGDLFDIVDESLAFGARQLTAEDLLPNRVCDLREKEVGGLESIFGSEPSGRRRRFPPPGRTT
jgi:hypothetical protein